MILFPEYGITTIELDNYQLKEHSELIPDPKKVRVTPCTNAREYSTRPILFTLSCMAKNNGIVVVANFVGRELCHGQSNCPDDGEFHYNANVAFDSNGRLIGRYYKEHLFYELALDLPKDKQDPVFETDFGKFAMFICFDIIYKKMVLVSQLTDVDAILFSTVWGAFNPFLTTVQWWQAWAMGNNATLLAANMHIPGYGVTGSGVYRGREGSIVSVFNPDGISKLIIATVPKRGRKFFPKTNIIAIQEHDIRQWNSSKKDIPAVCSLSILGKSKNITTDYRCADQNNSNYTLKRLTEAKGHVEVCNNGMCCELDYVTDNMEEKFYLGVFNGTRNFFKKYHFSEESCFLARCVNVNGTTCSLFVTHSETVFHKLSMRANFTTKYVYPSVMSSGMGLVPVKNWTFMQRTNKASIEFGSISGIHVLQATLMGRVYDKDPSGGHSSGFLLHSLLQHYKKI